MYPFLKKSYKGLYPFKIGTTSYIYPDHIIPNVKMLAPYLDEIELLLFESTPAGLPSKKDIKDLLFLAKEFNLSYNIHLPTDISLSSLNLSNRRHGIEVIKKVMDLVSPLLPSTCTLHLSYDEASRDENTVQRWRDFTYESMSQLIDTGINGNLLSIETLAYPFEWVEQIIYDLNLLVCIDLGHLIINGFNCNKIFDKYFEITPILHLHGVEKKRDHISLDRMSDIDMNSIITILKKFTGVVSLEVFSLDHLTASLNFLEIQWKEIKDL